jgi:hypothetical protein
MGIPKWVYFFQSSFGVSIKSRSKNKALPGCPLEQSAFFCIEKTEKDRPDGQI